MKLYNVSDHTAGGYCDPHIAEECKEHPNCSGDFYRAEDVKALASLTLSQTILHKFNCGVNINSASQPFQGVASVPPDDSACSCGLRDFLARLKAIAEAK